MNVLTMKNHAEETAATSPFPYESEMVCFAVLWVKSIASEITKQSLIDELVAREDIDDARYTTSGPLRLVVKYDGMMTVPSKIQALVDRPGVRAVIVGC